MFTESCPDIPIYTKTICSAPFIHRTGFVNLSAVIGATVLSRIIMGYPCVLDHTFHILKWNPNWPGSCGEFLEGGSISLVACFMFISSMFQTYQVYPPGNESIYHLGKSKSIFKSTVREYVIVPWAGYFFPSLHIKAQLFLVDDRPMICVKLCARAQNRKLVKGRKWRFCWTKMIEGQWKIQNSVDKKYSLDKSVLSLGRGRVLFLFLLFNSIADLKIWASGYKMVQWQNK